MYATVPELMDESQRKAVDRTLRLVEIATSPKVDGRTMLQHFPRRAEGELPLRSMRSTIEPLRWTHKPFMLYFVLQSKS
jgi:hypothetical protein